MLVVTLSQWMIVLCFCYFLESSCSRGWCRSPLGAGSIKYENNSLHVISRWRRRRRGKNRKTSQAKTRDLLAKKSRKTPYTIITNHISSLQTVRSKFYRGPGRRGPHSTAVCSGWTASVDTNNRLKIWIPMHIRFALLMRMVNLRQIQSNTGFCLGRQKGA